MEFVIDSERAEGPLAGLVAGLAWAERSGASFLLTVPCDAPFLPGDLVVRLLDRLRQTGAIAALPMSAGRLHPSCGLWRIDALMDAAAYIATGRTSLRGFAELVGLAVEDWGAPERDPFFNVNTLEDLAIAKGWLGQPHLE
jgi:molybdopterin-guanine dinucleotide biosynthesis protein A